MRTSGFVALAVIMALFAAACGPNGPVLADDSAPFESGTTFVPQTTTTELERDNSIAVQHRVLVDGSDIGTTYNTAVVRAEDVWELNPEAELDDSGSSVQLLFTAPETVSCPILDFQGLRFDPDTAYLYPAVEWGGSNCADMIAARPYTIVVDVQRSHLPREFILSAGQDVGTIGLTGQTEIGLGQLGIPDGDPLALKQSSNIMIGETRFVQFNTHCGVEQIGYLIDGKYWTLTSGPGGGDYIPSEWRRFVDGETIMLQLKLSTPELLFVSPSGTGLELAYEPIDESDLAGCM